MLVYRDDAPDRHHLPLPATGGPLPASWWEMVVGRAAHEIPGVVIEYADDPPGAR